MNASERRKWNKGWQEIENIIVERATETDSLEDFPNVAKRKAKND